VPSFIKQRWNIDGIFLPTFLSIEPGTASGLAEKLGFYTENHIWHHIDVIKENFRVS
jgi:hypothetical protein